MNDICIPIPKFKENEVAEVVVTVNGKKRFFNFRVESFPWTSIQDNKTEEIQKRVEKLCENIEKYDKDWGLRYKFILLFRTQVIFKFYLDKFRVFRNVEAIIENRNKKSFQTKYKVRNKIYGA